MTISKFNKTTHGKIYFNILSHFSNLSIFNKIFYGIIFIVFLIILVSSIISYTYLHIMYKNEAMNNALRLVDNINEGFQDNLDQIDRIITSIYADTRGTDSNPSMQDVIFSEDYSSLMDEYSSLNTVKNFFQRLIFLRKDFNSIFIFVSKNKIFSYAVNGANKLDYNPEGESWFKETVAAKGKTVIFAPHVPYQLNYNKKIISFSRFLKNVNKDPEVVVLIDLTLDSIDNIVNKAKLSKATGVLFLDGTGNVIYSKNAQYDEKDLSKEIFNRVIGKNNGKFTAKISKKKYLIAFNTSEITGWKLLTLTPDSEMSRDDKKILFFNLVLLFIALTITVFISYAFSRVVFNPIKKLKIGISKVKEGDFDFQLEHFSNDELGQLVMSFNSMISTIKTLIIEKYEERIAKNEAEFKYLQAQINPHFIYNTLQTISSMAVVKKVPEINHISKRLAKMLRYSVNTKNKLVSIKEEVENLTCYLDIQKLRFKDYLNYEINIEEEVCEYGIVKLVLQPIVENSIIHGIEPKGENGTIKVSGSIIDDKIYIKILDNGIGMLESTVEDQMRNINIIKETEARSFPGNENNNIGLKNINFRLKLVYGQEYGLKIESIKDRWTNVTVKIPARKLNMEESK